MLDRAIEYRYLTVGVVILLLILAIAMPAGGKIKFVGFPELEGDVVEARLLLPQGTPLKRTESLVNDIVLALERVDAQFKPRQPRGQELVRNVAVIFGENPDAFESGPLGSQETRTFWPAWFAAFPEMDYRVERTIAAETIVVTEWVFLGVHSGPLEHPIFDVRIEPSGRTIRLRGISVYDVDAGLICCETTYVDLSTLYVELGVSP